MAASYTSHVLDKRCGEVDISTSYCIIFSFGFFQLIASCIRIHLFLSHKSRSTINKSLFQLTLIDVCMYPKIDVFFFFAVVFALTSYFTEGREGGVRTSIPKRTIPIPSKQSGPPSA